MEARVQEIWEEPIFPRKWRLSDGVGADIGAITTIANDHHP